MKKYDKIVGIDPGISGGITVWTSEDVVTHKMPSYQVLKKNYKKKSETDIKELLSILQDHQQGYDMIVFLELVQAWTGKDSISRQYQISRMLANYESIKTVIKIIGIDLVEVRPQDWQFGLMIKFKGEQSKSRKARYKQYAKRRYPSLNVTAWNGDATCIMDYGRKKLQQMPEWVQHKLV